MSNPGTRSGLHDSGLLAAGSLVSGLAAYGFIALGTRSVGSDEFAAVSVLWTLWAISASVFTFPIQHWVIRTVEADAGEGKVRAGLPSLAISALVVSVLFGGICWMLRDRFFGSDGLLFPMLAALVPVGSVVMGLNRGVLASRRRFRSTSLAIAGENLIRVAVAIPMSTAGGLGVSLVAGFAVALFWPSSFRLGDSGHKTEDISPVAFVGGIAGGSLIGQIVLTSGPIALALVGGTPREITGLFSALALFRAPYMVAIGVTPRLTADLTRMALDRGHGAIRRLALQTLGMAVVLGGVAGGLGWSIGPALLQLVFGPDVLLSSLATGVVAAASTLALGALFLTVVMVAAGRVATVSIVWGAAAAVGVTYLLVGFGTSVDRVVSAFLISEICALGLMVFALVSRRFHAMTVR